MSNIYKLTGTLQHYVWGGKEYNLFRPNRNAVMCG